MDILSKIQQELKAPKSQWNKFSKFKYRSCEDILGAVKPLLGDAVITISDDVEMIGDRFYVKSTATISLKGDSVSCVGWAREQSTQKGMDEAQITGSVSSYARKYALNGLLAIDDQSDPDRGVGSSALPAYSLTSADLSSMIIDVSSGRATPESIIKFLKASYTVTPEMAEKISIEIHKGSKK